MRRWTWTTALVCGLAVGLAACPDEASTGSADTSIDTDTAGDTIDAGPEVEQDVDADSSDDVEAEVEPGCPPGTPCDDGDPCTTDDQCTDTGGCAGTPVDCDDGKVCTADSCGADGTCTSSLKAGFCLGVSDDCVSDNQPDPASTCHYCNGEDGTFGTFVDGATCDDGDVCTTVDSCAGGECVGGTPLQCPDDDPCGIASCDPVTGCTVEPNDGPCDDGDPCTEADDCSTGGCAGTPKDCDDGDPCTTDACDGATGDCVHVADACDDDDPCTDDSCDSADGSCTNAPFDGPCEDGDACTEGEMCSGGTCGGGAAVDCADDNGCTVDSCDPAVGCVNAFSDMGCDDGIACTVGDACQGGVCIGVKSGCTDCASPTTPLALKITALALGDSGQVGEGLDVDDDPGSCAPFGDCAAGIDNVLAFMAFLINQPLQDALDGGSLMYVIDLAQLTDGAAFPVSVYDSGLAQTCSYQFSECDYVASQLSFDGACEPYFKLDAVTYEGGKLVGGGPGEVISMALPFGGGVLALNLHRARVDADMELSGDGSNALSLNGLIAGAVVKQQLLDAVEAFDPDALPLDKDTIIGLLEDAIEPDIDLDGDGVNESASIGLKVTAIPANLVAP